MNLPGAAMETECGNAEQSLLQAQQGKYSSPGTHIALVSKSFFELCLKLKSSHQKVQIRVDESEM